MPPAETSSLSPNFAAKEKSTGDIPVASRIGLNGRTAVLEPLPPKLHRARPSWCHLGMHLTIG